MRNSKVKKKYSSALLFVKIFILTLCIFSFVQGAVGEATVVRNKNENILLKQQIRQMQIHNEKLKAHNKILQTGIEKAGMKKIETTKTKNISNTKIAYLTFDDGPSKNTTDILRVLKQYNIKATFFVNGHPNLRDLYKQISDDGHVLANHTYSHGYKIIYSSPSNFIKDVKRLDTFLTEITGKEPTHILRYPGGSNNNISVHYGGKDIMNIIIKEMNLEGYQYFDWNVDSSDASAFRQNKNIIVQTVLSQSKEHKRPVILLHDLDPKTTTVQALPEIIEGLKNQGFIFDVLSNNTYAPQFKVTIK